MDSEQRQTLVVGLLAELARRVEEVRRLVQAEGLDERRRRALVEFVRKAEALLRSSRLVQ